jgi:signal transduction histidine kinase
MSRIGEELIDRATLAAVIEDVVARAVASGAYGLGPDALRAAALRVISLVDAPDGTGGIGEAEAELLRNLTADLRAELVRSWSGRPVPPAAEQVLATLESLQVLSDDLSRRSGRRTTIGGLPDGYEFAAGVAHDLRSPITSILFLAETLLGGQSGEINETQRRQLGIIYSAALSLVTVASDIIELVRGGDGLTEREPTLFSITETLESVHDIVRPMAEEKGLGVHLFPPAMDLRYGHPLALSRVLLNLTTNGLKFTDAGFVEIAVRATGPTRLEFSVRDTGKGYSPEALDTLYEPFRRTRGGRDRWGFSGTGLGLAISRKLVNAMGSSLEVESRPRWGTRFYFEVELPPGPESGSTGPS